MIIWLDSHYLQARNLSGPLASLDVHSMALQGYLLCGFSIKRSPDWWLAQDCFDQFNSGSFCTFQILYTCAVRTDVDNSRQKREEEKKKWQTILLRLATFSCDFYVSDQKDQKDQRSTKALFSHTAIHVPHPICWAPKKSLLRHSLTAHSGTHTTFCPCGPPLKWPPHSSETIYPPETLSGQTHWPGTRKFA